jgi:hypothetical protein
LKVTIKLNATNREGSNVYKTDIEENIRSLRRVASGNMKLEDIGPVRDTISILLAIQSKLPDEPS